jgi:hypothetical protein
MFWLADAEVLGNGPSASMTHGHMSSGSASTHLLCLCDHNHLLQTWRASRLPHPQVMRPLRGAVSMPEALHRVLTLRNGGWYKQLRAILSKFIQRYSTLSLRGAGPKPRFGLIPGAGVPRTWVLISVLPNSVEKGGRDNLA